MRGNAVAVSGAAQGRARPQQVAAPQPVSAIRRRVAIHRCRARARGPTRTEHFSHCDTIYRSPLYFTSNFLFNFFYFRLSFPRLEIYNRPRSRIRFRSLYFTSLIILFSMRSDSSDESDPSGSVDKRRSVNSYIKTFKEKIPPVERHTEPLDGAGDAGAARPRT